MNKFLLLIYITNCIFLQSITFRRSFLSVLILVLKVLSLCLRYLMIRASKHLFIGAASNQCSKGKQLILCLESKLFFQNGFSVNPFANFLSFTVLFSWLQIKIQIWSHLYKERMQQRTITENMKMMCRSFTRLCQTVSYACIPVTIAPPCATVPPSYYFLRRQTKTLILACSYNW